MRRQINQGFFEKLLIGDNGSVEQAELTEPFRPLMGAGQAVLTSTGVTPGNDIDQTGIRLVDGVNEITMVDVVEALAHRSQPVRRLLERSAVWPDGLGEVVESSPPAYRTMRHLDASEVDQLVAAYRTGTKVAGLATQFSIHRSTVGKYLQTRGIDTREPKISPEDIQQAAELYREGWSLARLAEKFSVNDGTVRARLLEVGAVMRPRRGGYRAATT